MNSPNPSPTNEIGYPQYERTLENFYMWTSGGTFKDKLREFAIRYESGRVDNESELFLDQMHDAILAFFTEREQRLVVEARIDENQKHHEWARRAIESSNETYNQLSRSWEDGGIPGIAPSQKVMELSYTQIDRRFVKRIAQLGSNPKGAKVSVNLPVSKEVSSVTYSGQGIPLDGTLKNVTEKGSEG